MRYEIIADKMKGDEETDRVCATGIQRRDGHLEMIFLFLGRLCSYIHADDVVLCGALALYHSLSNCAYVEYLLGNAPFESLPSRKARWPFCRRGPPI